MSENDFAGLAAFPGRTRAKTLTDDQLMDLVMEKARKPERFEADGVDPYFWAAEISSDRIDSYFTTMDKTSLKNYAEDASTGVAFMSGHDTRQLPLGQSLYGAFTPGRGEKPSLVEADFYTMPGLSINGVNTDEFIKAVDYGIVRDVSIGFHGGEWMCNICGRDMADWSDWDNMCWHMPGIEYPVYNKAGEETGERVLCIANITNARLSEVSAVFDGATPGASIRQAMKLAEAGKLPAKAARKIESFYQNRFKIPGAQERNWNLGAIDSGKEDTMTVRNGEATKIGDATELDEVREPDLEEAVQADAVVENDSPPANTAPPAEAAEVPAATEPVEEAPVQAAVGAANEPETAPEASAEAESTEDPNEGTQAEGSEDRAAEPQGDAEDMGLREDLRAVIATAGLGETSDDPLEGARLMVTELERLRPLADVGRQYRADLIDETIDAGVRAYGNEFPSEQRRATFAKLELDEIKGFNAEYRAKAEGNFTPGRSTNEVDEAPVAEVVEEAVRKPGSQNLVTSGRDRLPVTAFSA